MSVRERVREVQKLLRAGSPTPDQVREALVTVTALLGNVNDELREADHEYKLVLLGCLQGDEAANRARIRAEVTPQYVRAREAKDTRDLVVELIRSSKTYLRSLDTEMQLSR